MSDKFSRYLSDQIDAIAELRSISVRDLILELYSGINEPPCFADDRELLELYGKHKAHIEKTINHARHSLQLSESDKSYFCYRLYLHALCMNEFRHSYSASRRELQFALRKFWASRGQMLTQDCEQALIKFFDQQTESEHSPKR